LLDLCFDNPPSFDEVITRIRLLLDVPLNVLRFCCVVGYAGDKRAHYVLMPLKSYDDWKFYKELQKGSQVNCAEVVVETNRRVVGKLFPAGD
jgi:hypothetical protein